MSHKEYSFIQTTPGVQHDLPTTNVVNNYHTYKTNSRIFHVAFQILNYSTDTKIYLLKCPILCIQFVARFSCYIRNIKVFAIHEVDCMISNAGYVLQYLNLFYLQQVFRYFLPGISLVVTHSIDYDFFSKKMGKQLFFIFLRNSSATHPIFMSRFIICNNWKTLIGLLLFSPTFRRIFFFLEKVIDHSFIHSKRLCFLRKLETKK